MNVTKVSKTERLLEALQSGEEFTVGQMKSRFKLANPTATISDLRYQGFCIYGNQKRDSKGQHVTKYRIGTPTRALIAAGYRAQSLGIA